MEPLRQELEAPFINATSRGLQRFPPPAGAGEFHVAGLTCSLEPMAGRFRVMVMTNLKSLSTVLVNAALKSLYRTGPLRVFMPVKCVALSFSVAEPHISFSTMNEFWLEYSLMWSGRNAKVLYM